MHYACMSVMCAIIIIICKESEYHTVQTDTSKPMASSSQGCSLKRTKFAEFGTGAEVDTRTQRRHK